MLETITHKIWPPPYKVRFSDRAKHMQLKIHPRTGLEVIIPSFRKRYNINKLLNEKRTWIEKNLHIISKTPNNEPYSVQFDIIKQLKKCAKEIFTLKLNALSDITQLEFNKICIRGQKTRWGSCSAQKNITINFKLLFLPPVIVNYVLLHELCHTKYLNHSTKFWQLVAKFDTNYKAHDKVLKSGDQFIPEWILYF